MNQPYTIDPVLTGFSLAYKNGVLIADRVLPRLFVAGVNYKYWRWDFAQFATLTDTVIGRKSPPNEVEFNATEVQAGLIDYGLMDYVPQSDLDRAPKNQPNPQRVSVVGTTDLVLLAREVRAANLVTNLATYGAANKVTLSGTGQWSDFVNANPVDEILSKLDTMLMRPNKLVMGRAVYTKLRQHPKVLAAAFPTGGNVGASGGGVASKQAIADLLEVDEIIVGEGWVNTAKKGQASVLSRVWGKDCVAIYQDGVSLQMGAQSETRASYGFTAEFEPRFVQTWYEDKLGVKGANGIKVVEQLNECICAPDLGYLWKNAVA